MALVRERKTHLLKKTLNPKESGKNAYNSVERHGNRGIVGFLEKRKLITELIKIFLHVPNTGNRKMSIFQNKLF